MTNLEYRTGRYPRVKNRLVDVTSGPACKLYATNLDKRTKRGTRTVCRKPKVTSARQNSPSRKTNKQFLRQMVTPLLLLKEALPPKLSSKLALIHSCRAILIRKEFAQKTTLSFVVLARLKLQVVATRSLSALFVVWKVRQRKLVYRARRMFVKRQLSPPLLITLMTALSALNVVIVSPRYRCHVLILAKRSLTVANPSSVNGKLLSSPLVTRTNAPLVAAVKALAMMHRWLAYLVSPVVDPI